MILVLAVSSLWFFAAPINQTQPQSDYSLPDNNRVLDLPKAAGYLYASNQPLPDLLPEIDIFFKAQSLNSDKDSEIFKYTTSSRDGTGEAGTPPIIETCVEFKYFEEAELATVVTFIPDNPDCYTKDTELQAKIRNLQEEFSYIYAAEVAQP